MGPVPGAVRAWLRVALGAGGVATAVAAAAGPAGAQGTPPPPGPAARPVRLEVRLSPDSTPNGARVPLVRSEHLLDNERWLGTLRSGLPVRLHYRVEVWRARGGWFDRFARQAEWDVLLRHEPLLDHYTMLTLAGGVTQERRFATLDALAAALGFTYRVTIAPSERGSYYYAASLQVSTLSDSELDELEQFLEGDVDAGEGRGERTGSAVGREARRFLLRLAGLPSLRLEARSGEFRVR